MKGPSYQELKRKYLALLDENKALKAKIRELEAQTGSVPWQSPSPKNNPSPEPKPFEPGPVRKPPSGFARGIPPMDAPVNNYSPIDQKIALFISRFRGRSDVYAKKWQSKKGKSGYSPVCRNEWRPGICGKPAAKCFQCPHKSHAPLTEAVIENHLRGRLVAGIYPLKPDETCHFLAIDFDKKEWKQDISVIRETCSRFEIPLAVERSQSGNGCHAWFFFRHRVPACLARKFGTALLTHSMKKRHEIPFESYDRLFPNQDTMPKGGYGNLIALPLQKSARDKGNSVFIDENFAPCPDQWDFLSGLLELDKTQLNAFIGKLVKGEELGVLKTCPEEETRPWETGPQKLSAHDFPQNVEIVRSGMLFVNKKGFSQRALNALKRCAAFKNPVFYKAQAMRLPTRGKPRVISCADDHTTHLALPRGCEHDLCSLLEKHGADIKWEDKNNPGKAIDVEFHGILRDEQQDAVDALLARDNGVLAAATAFGKTVVGAKLIAEKKVNTLVLVHRQQLVSQWRERLARFLVINEPLPKLPRKRGRKPKQDLIGHMAAGKNRLGSIVDVAVMQSMNRRGNVHDCVRNYGMIIVDECHHVPAVTFERILKQTDAKTVYGLTATPARPDGHHPIIFFYCGPVRFSVDAKKQAEKRPFTHCLIPRFTSFKAGPGRDGKELSIHEIRARLCADEIRNQLIVDDVAGCWEKGRTAIVLTGRKAHVEALGKRLEKRVRRLICLTGGMGTQRTARIMAAIRSIPPDEPFVLVSTGAYIGEGFDEPRLDTLFLAMPISWKGTLQQYAGRLHRLCKNKKEVRVYDYVDLHVKMLERMYGRRLRGYAAIGYRAGVDNFPGAPTNIIFNKDTFFPVYLQDIKKASKAVVIVSPFVTLKRMLQMMGYFKRILEKQVQITIMTRPSTDFQAEKRNQLEEIFAMMTAAGIHLILKSSIHQKFAVIDETITWYGSINLLSFGYSEESIMRLESSCIAYELMAANDFPQ